MLVELLLKLSEAHCKNMYFHGRFFVASLLYIAELNLVVIL